MLLGLTQGQPGYPATLWAGAEQATRGVVQAGQGLGPAPASPPGAWPAAPSAQALPGLKTRPSPAARCVNSGSSTQRRMD